MADNLFEQAVATRGRFGQSQIQQVDRHGQQLGRWDGANRAAFLLAGFALENMLKGFLVYENPTWISNGTLASPLRTHTLTKLQRAAKTVPYKNSLLWVPRALEDGLESWARYPSALKASDSKPEQVLSLTVWNGFERLMAAYSRRLATQLSASVWRGPHGFEGRWKFKGEFLGATLDLG